MARLRIYTVHINPALPHPHESAEFVKEGFSWIAFVFTGLWALYNRLWTQAVCILVFNATVLSLQQNEIMAAPGCLILHFGLQLFVGFQATDWQRDRLKGKGYLITDIATGDSQLRAEQRYFDRYFAARSTPIPV